MAQPPFPQFVNFTAATRKPFLLPSYYFSPTQDTAWIFGIAPSGVSLTPQNLIGTIDGINPIFTVPSTISGGVAIYRNGVLQTPTLAYSITSNTVTFNTANIPQPGDDLECLIS